MKLIRVVAPHFVAGFETDGKVRVAAPILRDHLLGKTDDEARAIIAKKGWKASVVAVFDIEPDVKGHEFITVRNRRWCLGCDLFQYGDGGAIPKFKVPRSKCLEITNRAKGRREQRTSLAVHSAPPPDDQDT